MTRKDDGSVLVAWCPDCDYCLPEEEIGQRCADCPRHLVKRRGYICGECAEGLVFWKKNEFKAHVKAEHEAQGPKEEPPPNER